MATKSADKYTEGVGRRKTAVARVRITPSGSNKITVNDKDVASFFGTEAQRATAIAALSLESVGEKFEVTAHVKGGGPSAQAEAVRHGMARALIARSPELRAELKKQGFLKRDPRMVERKHFGLRKARRAPQWSKR